MSQLLIDEPDLTLVQIIRNLIRRPLSSAEKATEIVDLYADIGVDNARSKRMLNRYERMGVTQRRLVELREEFPELFD